MSLHKIDTDELLKPMSYLGAAVGEWRLLQQLEGHMVPQAIDFDVRVGFLKSADMLKDAAKKLGMLAAARVIEQGWEEAFALSALRRPLSAHELQRMTIYADKILSVFIAEASNVSLMSLSPAHSAFLDPSTPPFGQPVYDAFPSAVPDIVDAGHSRAFGLWTACVMHLMRALEPALAALAASLDVEVGQNWNTALNQIDTALREIRKSTNGATEEQWASEAVLQLRAIKNAWRNHAMHGVGRYGEEDAVRIYESVKFLMQTLAARLSE
jgi:hypothetical protein